MLFAAFPPWLCSVGNAVEWKGGRSVNSHHLEALGGRRSKAQPFGSKLRQLNRRRQVVTPTCDISLGLVVLKGNYEMFIGKQSAFPEFCKGFFHEF